MNKQISTDCGDIPTILDFTKENCNSDGDV
jgi:hypothetical protein